MALTLVKRIDLEPRETRTVTTVRAILYPQNNPGQLWVGEYLDGATKKGYLGFPGGQMKTGEVMHDALYREIAEETGLAKADLEIHTLRPVEQAHPFGTAHCFVACTLNSKAPTDTAEMANWQLYTPKQALALSTLADFCKSYLEDWLKRADFPIK